MRKKNYFVTAIAMAAVIVCGTLGVGSVKTVDTNAAEKTTAQEDIYYEQVGRDEYDKCYMDQHIAAKIMLSSEDNKYLTIIETYEGRCGDIHHIDNSTGKYGNILDMSSDFYNYLVSEKDGKVALLDYDGNIVLDGKYHSRVINFLDWTKGTLFAPEYEYICLMDDNQIVIYNPEGIVDRKITYSEDISKVSYIEYAFSDCTIIDGKNRSIYDKSGKDVTSNIQREGYYISSIDPSRDKYIKVYYQEDNSTSQDTRLTVYYDENFREVSEEEVKNYIKSLSSNTTQDVSSKGFNWKHDIYPEIIITDEGYQLTCSSYFGGYKLFYGELQSDRQSRAIFDENKNMLIQNVASWLFCPGDKVILKEKDSEGNYKYKIIKVSLKSETGIADIVTKDDGSVEGGVAAKDIDKDNILDSDGKAVNYDALDKDAKAAIEQKFDFNIKAGAGVIPANSHMSISKVVAGKEYNAAKQVTQSVVSRMAVFNIDLLNRDNVKIQPTGKLEITVDIPNDYNTERLAVYRLSEDGNSYIKLNSKVADGKIVFETDHFSTYMVVEEASQELTTSGEEVTTGEAENAPDTGDINNLYALIAVMIVVALVEVVAFRRKRA